MSTNKPFYLAGPMTGIPQFNFPTFDRVAKVLRDSGWHIVSPAELDLPSTREVVLQSPDGKYGPDGRLAHESWGEILARDVRLVADECQGVILLPGWEKSRGAKLEAFVGLLCQHRFFLWDEKEQTPHRIDGDYIRKGVIS